MVTILSLQQKLLEIARREPNELYEVDDYLEFKLKRLKARKKPEDRPNAEVLDFETTKKGE